MITALSGIRVRQLTEVGDILEQMPPETEVTFFVRRSPADQLISVTLGHPPAGAATGGGGREAGGAKPEAGVGNGTSPVPRPPSLAALLQRIEALERDVAALKEQNRRLEERVEALQRPAAPKAPSP